MGVAISIQNQKVEGSYLVSSRILDGNGVKARIDSYTLICFNWKLEKFDGQMRHANKIIFKKARWLMVN